MRIVCLSLIGCLCFFASTGSGESTKKSDRKTFTEIIAEHPTPNLDDLAKRSEQGARDPNVSVIPFYDLLKLRTVGTAEAIPILEQVIKDDKYSGRIHSYAATQALFCIGTPKAHEILKQHIFDNRYNTQQGISYTFYWEMAEPKRSAFIEQYHINNRSQTLKIDLAAKSETLTGIETITIMAILTNISQKPYRFCDYPFAFGDHLYLRNQNERFIHKLRTATGYSSPEKWIELKPGQTKQYQTTMEVANADQLYQSLRRYLKNGDLWLRENHSNAFFIENPGQFQIIAMLERSPLSKEHIERLGFDNAWIGRAVSKPVTITIKPVK